MGRVLVVGAGSGRDIANAVLATEPLQEAGWQVDLAGFLTPWALHRFRGRLEKPVNRLEGESVKFHAWREAELLDGYFEPVLAQLNGPLRLGISNFYGFSLQYGIAALEEAIQRLAERRRYEKIVLVDVGGDVLAGVRGLRELFTPIVDLTAVRAFSRIHTDAERLLVVMGAGTDGELAPGTLRAAVARLRKWTVGTEWLDARGSAYWKVVQVNREIERRTSARSGTGALLAKALAARRGFRVQVQRRMALPWGRYQFTFVHRIDPLLAGTVFTFQLAGVARLAAKAPAYRSVLEAHRWFRPRCAGTEVDMAPLFLDGPGSETALSLTPMERAPGALRARILRDGAQFAAAGGTALVLRKDLRMMLLRGIAVERLDQNFAVLRCGNVRSRTA